MGCLILSWLSGSYWNAEVSALKKAWGNTPFSPPPKRDFDAEKKGGGGGGEQRRHLFCPTSKTPPGLLLARKKACWSTVRGGKGGVFLHLNRDRGVKIGGWVRQWMWLEGSREEI